MRLLLQQESFGSRDGAVQEMHGGEPEEGQGAIPEKGDTMSEVKIKVPKGCCKRAGPYSYDREEGSESRSCVRWMAENPIVPKTLMSCLRWIWIQAWERRGRLIRAETSGDYLTGSVLSEWQRRMFSLLDRNSGNANCSH